MSTSLIPYTYRADFQLLPSWKNFRSRTFRFLIYPEWEHYKDVFIRLKSLNFTYLAIGPVHDMDLKEDGTLDKPHHHAVIRFQNAHWAYSFAKSCLLTAAILPCDSLRGAVRYFIHADHPEKYQYDKADIFSTNPGLTESFFNDIHSLEDSADELVFIQEIKYLIKCHQFDSELDIAEYCIQNGYGTFFRRYKYQIHSDYASSRYEVHNKNKNRKE